MFKLKRISYAKYIDNSLSGKMMFKPLFSREQAFEEMADEYYYLKNRVEDHEKRLIKLRTLNAPSVILKRELEIQANIKFQLSVVSDYRIQRQAAFH